MSLNNAYSPELINNFWASLLICACAADIIWLMYYMANGENISDRPAALGLGALLVVLFVVGVVFYAYGTGIGHF